jgi:hypothetical protein
MEQISEVKNAVKTIHGYLKKAENFRKSRLFQESRKIY